MTTRFMFQDGDGVKYHLTLRKASAEWCNLDCPTLWCESSDPALNGLRINSGGTYIEALPAELERLFIRFVQTSSEAFYRKYPQCRHEPGLRNGFMANLIRHNPKEWARFQRI